MPFDARRFPEGFRLALILGSLLIGATAVGEGEETKPDRIRHLANANKARHLETVNIQMHLGLPRVVTPNQLQAWEDLE
jgi:hypothetical protein